MIKLPALFLCLVLLLGPIHTAAAQSPGIDDLAAMALENDPGELSTRLETPPSDEFLPEGFSTASALDANLESEELETYRSAGFDDLVAVRTFSIATEPEEVQAPSPSASPQATPTAQNRPGVEFYTSGTITYLIFDSELDPDAMDQFGETINTVLGQSDGAGSMELTDYQGAAAFRIRASNLVNGVQLRSEWLVIPVGNVAIVASYMAGSDQQEGELNTEVTDLLAESALVWLAEQLQHEPVGYLRPNDHTR